MLLLLTYSGQRGAALAHYDAYCRTLAAELGIEPSEETIALYQRIRSGDLAKPSVPAAKHNLSVPADRSHADILSQPRRSSFRAPALPLQPGPFVGREGELAQIAERLAHPSCRLLTLVGPGGIGKTRLALQAAAESSSLFPDGVAFVALAPISVRGTETVSLLAAAIVDALGLSSTGQHDLQAELLAYVREKRMLLVLDNFEHLLDGVGLLTDILRSASQLTFLITSRERLNLQSEWLVDVQGLAYPPYEVPGEAAADPLFNRALPEQSQLESYGAVQLFVQHATRVQPNFMLTAATIPAVMRICQLVEGVPLGIEIAAAWIRTIPCSQIAQEIGRNLDFLATTQRDVPARHRSMRAVFDHSWNLLAEAERTALRRLSVFRGGFGHGAAETVAEASLQLLAALMDKSLLRQDGTGRYDLHELVRQYAEEKLPAASEERQQLHSRHSRYYAEWLSRREARLTGDQQREVLAEIGAELENVRAAWDWAIARRDMTSLALSLESLALFCDTRGRFQEGYEIFAQAGAALRAGPPATGSARTVARLLARQGIFCERLGRYAEGIAELRQSLALFHDSDDQQEIAFALGALGRIFDRQGDYREARCLHQESLDLYRAIDDRRGIASALYYLGSATEGLREYPEAKRLTEESLAIRRAIGDQRGVAYGLNVLGVIVEMLEDYPEAIRLYQESLALFADLDERWAMTLPLSNLGDVAYTLADYHAAQAYYRQALQIAMELWAVPQMLINLVKTARLLAQAGERERAVELLALPLHYSATEQAFRGQAEHLLAELATELTSEAITIALARGRACTLEATVQALLAEGSIRL